QAREPVRAAFRRPSRAAPLGRAPPLARGCPPRKIPALSQTSCSHAYVSPLPAKIGQPRPGAPLPDDHVHRCRSGDLLAVRSAAGAGASPEAQNRHATHPVLGPFAHRLPPLPTAAAPAKQETSS